MPDEAPQLTHLDAAGQARMVDVSGKDATRRAAVALGRVTMQSATLHALRAHGLAKG